jgi:hypothetical protein
MKKKKMRRQKRNLIRVFTFIRWCFISTYYWALVLRHSPSKYFTNSSYILRRVDDNIKEEKKEKETLVSRHGNLDLDSGARQEVRS